MYKYRFAVITIGLIFIFSALSFIGCQRPGVGTEGYKDPMADKSQFVETDEFDYLVDLEQWSDQMGGTLSTAVVEPGAKKVEGTPSSPEPVKVFEQKLLSSQANDKVVKAHGEYAMLQEHEFVKFLAGAGTTEIKLPAHFPEDRYIGHIFMAGPRQGTELILDMASDVIDMYGGSETGEQGETGMAFNLDMFLQMAGFETREEVYNWIGDELLISYISNPDFDVEAEQTFENPPMFTVTSIACSDSAQGLAALKKLLDLSSMFLGAVPEEGKVGENNALIMPIPDLSGMFEGMELDEQQKKQVESLKEIPPLACVAVPGYILMSDQPSMEKLIGIYTPESEGTGRLASMEVQVNWDLLIDNFSPENPGVLLGMIEDEDIKVLISKLYNEIKDLKELGLSRGTVIVSDAENFEFDILTTKESLKVLEAIKKIIEETPDETWEKLGKKFGESMQGESQVGIPEEGEMAAPEVGEKEVPVEEGIVEPDGTV